MSMCYVSVVFVVVVSDGQWELLKTTALAGAAVVGIMNPASGNHVNPCQSLMSLNVDQRVNQRPSMSINTCI